MSMTAHKVYGPKGIGALYVAERPGVHVEPLLFGGGQQRRLRPGTLPAQQIVGFGSAARLHSARMDDDLDATECAARPILVRNPRYSRGLAERR